MRRCPNPGCPFVVRHGFAAEFEDAVERCRTCDAGLSAPEPESAGPDAALGPALGRLGMALGLLLGVFGFAASPVPGLDALRAAGADASFASLALWPGLIAWAAAQSVVQPLLQSRRSKPAILLATAIGSLALLAGFAAGLAHGLAALGLPTPGFAALLLPSCAGVLVVLGVVLVNDRWGLTHGLSLVLAALLLRGLVATLGDAPDPLQPLLTTLALITGAALWLAIPARAAASGRRSASEQELGLGLTVPTCALLPALLLAALGPLRAALESGPAALVHVYLFNLAEPPPPSPLPLLGEAALALLLAAAFAWLFARPAQLLAHWRRAFPRADERALEREASALARRALLRSALLVALIALLLRAQLPALSATILAAIALDLAAELKLRLAHDDLRLVELAHELVAAEALTQALRLEGRPAALQNHHHRALYQTLGRALPLRVLVREPDAAQATALTSSSPKQR